MSRDHWVFNSYDMTDLHAHHTYKIILTYKQNKLCGKETKLVKINVMKFEKVSNLTNLKKF